MLDTGRPRLPCNRPRLSPSHRGLIGDNSPISVLMQTTVRRVTKSSGMSAPRSDSSAIAHCSEFPLSITIEPKNTTGNAATTVIVGHIREIKNGDEIDERDADDAKRDGFCCHTFMA